MKKLFVAIVSLLMAATASWAGKDIDFRSAVSGAFWADQLYGIKPLNDGESYARVSPDRKRIVRYSFKTGEEVGTILDLNTAKGEKPASFSD